MPSEKMRYDAGDRTFCDAIRVDGTENALRLVTKKGVPPRLVSSSIVRFITTLP
jgi:hypothetical protein